MEFDKKSKKKELTIKAKKHCISQNNQPQNFVVVYVANSAYISPQIRCGLTQSQCAVAKNGAA
jgi:hypothetical protein